MLVCLPVKATTFTITLLQPSEVKVTKDAFVRFELKNYGANVPRVIGSHVILSSIVDFRPDTNGIVSGTITGNDVISPINTYYSIGFFKGGTRFYTCDMIISGSTQDLDNTSCLATGTPPVPFTSCVQCSGSSNNYVAGGQTSPTPPTSACPADQVMTGVDNSGNAICTTISGGGFPRWDQILDELSGVGYNKQAEMYNFYLDFNNIPQLGLVNSSGSLCIGGLNSAGNEASCTGTNAVGIGPNAVTTATNSISLGYSNAADGNPSIVIGNNSSASAADDIVLGDTNAASFNDNIMIGDGVTCADAHCISIGYQTSVGALTNGGIAIGAFATLSNGSGIGGSGQDVNPDSIAIGSNANGNSRDSVAIGENAQNYCCSLGTTEEDGGGQVAIGMNATTQATGDVALGKDSFCQNQACVAIGFGASSTTSFEFSSIAIGINALVSGKQSIAIGTNVNAVDDGCITMGYTGSGANSCHGVNTFNLPSTFTIYIGTNAGVSVSGASCTVKAIVGGIVTSATCP